MVEAPTLENVVEWDCCDEHQTTFPKGDECSVCTDNYDPTHWCDACGALTEENCTCGPIAEND